MPARIGFSYAEGEDLNAAEGLVFAHEGDEVAFFVGPEQALFIDDAGDDVAMAEVPVLGNEHAGAPHARITAGGGEILQRKRPSRRFWNSGVLPPQRRPSPSLLFASRLHKKTSVPLLVASKSRS